MPRSAGLAESQFPEASRLVGSAVKFKPGTSSNIIGVLADASAALSACVSLSKALAGATLSGAERDEVALAVAQANGCAYGVSAQSLVVQIAGSTLVNDLAARQDNRSPLTEFARKVTLNRAQLSDQDVASARAAGLTNAQIVEVLALVAFNMLSSYVNHIAAIDIDFPVGPP